MSLLQRVIGNATSADINDLKSKYDRLLFNKEEIEFGFKLIRDVFLFTSHRFILIDVQGITGSKIEYRTIPYGSISRFSLETAGTFDLDAELKIWISGNPRPAVNKKFNRNMDVYTVHRFLAMKVLGETDDVVTMNRSKIRPSSDFIGSNQDIASNPVQPHVSSNLHETPQQTSSDSKTPVISRPTRSEKQEEYVSSVSNNGSRRISADINSEKLKRTLLGGSSVLLFCFLLYIGMSNFFGWQKTNKISNSSPSVEQIWLLSKEAYQDKDFETTLELLETLKVNHPDFAEKNNVDAIISKVEAKRNE